MLSVNPAVQHLSKCTIRCTLFFWAWTFPSNILFFLYTVFLLFSASPHSSLSLCVPLSHSSCNLIDFSVEFTRNIFPILQFQFFFLELFSIFFYYLYSSVAYTQIVDTNHKAIAQFCSNDSQPRHNAKRKPWIFGLFLDKNAKVVQKYTRAIVTVLTYDGISMYTHSRLSCNLNRPNIIIIQLERITRIA